MEQHVKVDLAAQGWCVRPIACPREVKAGFPAYSPAGSSSQPACQGRQEMCERHVSWQRVAGMRRNAPTDLRGLECSWRLQVAGLRCGGR